MIISKVDIATLKSLIEMIIGVVCVPMIFMRQVALIFPIIYCQYVRIKYVSSFTMKEACKILNRALLERFIPEFVRSSSVYVWIANYLYSYVNFGEDDPKKKGEAAAKKMEEKSFRENASKGDAGAEYAKQFTQGQQGSQG